MKAVFLDTGYVLALELARDQNHQSALRHWQQVQTTLPTMVTTSYVFSEIVTFLNHRGHHTRAVKVGDDILASRSVELIHIGEPLFHAGWSYLKKHADKDYSLTDCISFLIMQQRGIDEAFTFDEHFSQAGFQKVP